MKKLFILFLLFPILAYAEIFDVEVRVNGQGKIYPQKLNTLNSSDMRYYDKQKLNGNVWKTTYSKDARFVLSNGARSSGTLPGLIEHQVQKKSVMVGLLKNARTGAK